MHQSRPLLSSIPILSLLIASFSTMTICAEVGAVPLGTGSTSAAMDRPVPETGFLQSPPTSFWAPVGPPRAAMLCIHGLGLHRGTYGQFAAAMANRNVAVFALDLRGFGTWYQQGQPKLDFDGSMKDVRQVLTSIKARYPKLPIFLLGESMGGAVALRAAVQNPDLVSGLISSVPSNDRFGGLGQDLHVPLRILGGGFRERFDVGTHVIQYATAKADLRDLWKNDPRGRNQFSPQELMVFQGFMKKNFDMASQVKELPVLVVQGAKDKLVRPSGTWDVWDHLNTPNFDIALSSNAEHLIFEYGQFSADDLNYVSNWLDKRMSKESAVDDSQLAMTKPPEEVPQRVVQTKEGDVVPASMASATSQGTDKLSISYWIELMRDGKRFRCNNKTGFRSGDEIRLHVRANVDGYAYILLKAGSSGKHAVLFPDEQTGRYNRIAALRDMALPTKSWLRFDNNPGQERVSIVFSRKPIEPKPQDPALLTAFVSPDRSGAKDLVPTRMELSWGDPNPVIIPASIQNNSALAVASGPALEANLVKVSYANPDGVLSVDVALDHN